MPVHQTLNLKTKYRPTFVNTNTDLCIPLSLFSTLDGPVSILHKRLPREEAMPGRRDGGRSGDGHQEMGTPGGRATLRVRGGCVFQDHGLEACRQQMEILLQV